MFKTFYVGNDVSSLSLARDRLRRHIICRAVFSFNYIYSKSRCVANKYGRDY